MIYVDENEPIGELRPEFDHRSVLIKRNRDVRTEYEMLHEIGRGKFGRVMKCRDLECTDKYYAAKFVHTTRRDDRRNVEREVEIMNSLNHPKLLKLFDAYDNGRNEMCIMTEYIGGGELFDRVIEDEFVLTEKACIAFMKQILQGVEFIHSQQIVHLDLKPENILCHTKTGNRIKIIDFGLARRYEPMKKMQVLFGTPEFVAPEVVNFEPIGYATDMWAVGVICYVLLSGLSPFMGDTDLETMANVTIAEYDYEDEVFDSVSDNAKDFIDKLLKKEKGKRFSSKSCLQHPWINDANNSKALLNAKENISSFQKDPSKKSNYYIFDHSNHTITPTDESSLALSAADVNRKRSLLENCKENESKRCKTPTREDVVIINTPKKETSSNSNCLERSLTPCWEESKPIVLQSAESKDSKLDMSWEPPDSKAPAVGSGVLEEENKENNLPLHPETLVNANEIEDSKVSSSSSAISEPKSISSPSFPPVVNVCPSPTSSKSSCSSMLSASSSSQEMTASAAADPMSPSSSISSSPASDLCDSYPTTLQQSRGVIDSSPENIFADIKDLIRNCPEPKARIPSSSSSQAQPSPTDRLNRDASPIQARLELVPPPKAPESFEDSSIAELSNKVENTMSTGIAAPRRGRSSRLPESTSNSISLVKNRFENPRSTVVGTKSPFTSILNRHSDELHESSRHKNKLEPVSTLRKRSPSPVFTGAVNRAKGRFENIGGGGNSATAASYERRSSNSSISSLKSTTYNHSNNRTSRTYIAPASASSPSAPKVFNYHSRTKPGMGLISPSILSTTLNKKISNSRTPSATSGGSHVESQFGRGGPFGCF